MQWRITGFSLMALVLVGCGADHTVQLGAEPEPKALEWQETTLTAQPALDRLRERVGSDRGHAPGTTEWRSAPMHQEARETRAGSPGRLLQKIALALGDGDFLGSDVWEQTVRVWQSDEQNAVGVILYWGYKDDSMAGRDLRLTMVLDTNLWRPVELEERFQCRRGVANGLCL